MNKTLVAENAAATVSSHRIELLGIELLEEHARRLAVLFTVERRPRGSGGAHLRRLKENRRALSSIYVALAEDARPCA